MTKGATFISDGLWVDLSEIVLLRRNDASIERGWPEIWILAMRLGIKGHGMEHTITAEQGRSIDLLLHAALVDQEASV